MTSRRREARERRVYAARAAGARADHQAVRDLLYATVMDGGANEDEQRLLIAACRALHDRDCSNAVRALYAKDAGEPDAETQP